MSRRPADTEGLMRTIHEATGALFREVMLGALLGLVILGVGGRIAMRVVAVDLGQPPSFDAEGTLTVILAGAAAGAAGMLLYAISRAVARLIASGRQAPHSGWTRLLRLTMFAALLALVTARGLGGSPGPKWMFWVVVALYGAVLELALVRRARKAAARESGANAATRGLTVASMLLTIFAACAEPRSRTASDSPAAISETIDPEAAFRAQLGRTWELARLGTQDIPPKPETTAARDPRRHPGPGNRPTIQFTADRADATLADSGLSRAGGWSFSNGYGAAYRACQGDALSYNQ